MAFKKVQDKKEISGLPAELPSEELLEAAAPTSTINIKEIMELQQSIRKVHTEGVSLEDAERLAAKSLDVLIQIGGMDGLIRSKDLDARMKKNGYKTVRAKTYIEIVHRSEKKPTEAAIEAELLTSALVSTSQDQYERAEVEAEALHRLYDIFKDAHIYFRGVAKGSFNGN